MSAAPARRRVALAVAGLLLAGCSGPREPLEVGVREVPTDVVLGRRATVPPVPPASPRPGGPKVLVPPPPVVPVFPSQPEPVDPRPVPTASPTGCPKLDPLAAPRREAPNLTPGPPVDATAVYTTSGTFGVEPDVERYPPTALRRVQLVERFEDGSFTYSVTQALGESTTTTYYRSVPPGPVPGSGGLYVVQIDGVRLDGTSTSFRPAPEMQLVRYPIVHGESFDVAVFDAETATTVTYTSTITGKVRADACGTPLDAWQVDLTEGTVRGLDTELAFTASLALGTQYGGISLHDVTDVSGREQGAATARRLVATVVREPEPAE